MSSFFESMNELGVGRDGVPNCGSTVKRAWTSAVPDVLSSVVEIAKPFMCAVSVCSSLACWVLAIWTKRCKCDKKKCDMYLPLDHF